MGFNKQISDWQAELILLADLARSQHTSVAAQAAAATFELPVAIVPTASAGADLRRLAVIFSTAIAGGASANTATLQFRQYRRDGTLVGTIGGTYVTTTAAAAFAEVTLTTAQAALRAGDILTLRLTSGGTGAALPAFLAVAEIAPSVQPS